MRIIFHLLLVAVLLVISPSSFAQERQKELYSTESYEWSDYSKNLRVFVFNLLNAGIHVSSERKLLKKWRWAIEGQWMPSEVSGSVVGGTNPYKARESYIGPTALYFFDKYYTGWFFEGGVNLADVWTISGSQDTTKRGALYIMPHFNFAYRIPTSIKGLHTNIGVGMFNYWGERLYYVDSSGAEQATLYNGQWAYRLRLDVGLFY